MPLVPHCFHRALSQPRPSKYCGQVNPLDLATDSIPALSASRLMPRICRPLLPYFSLIETMCGASAMHGPHQVAQKSTTIILPCICSRSTDLPSTVLYDSFACCPTWMAAWVVGAEKKSNE